METQEIIFTLLKQISEGNSKLNSTDLNIGIQIFGDIIEIVQNDGLITGANVIRGGQGNPVQMVLLDNSKITMKGLDYLHEKRNDEKLKINGGEIIVGEVVSESDFNTSVTVKGRPIRQSFPEWISVVSPLLSRSSIEIIKIIGIKLQYKFDVQGGFAKTSVHLYKKNETNVVFTHLKIIDKSIKCVGTSGLKGKHVKAHKCVVKLKELGIIDGSNVVEFLNILDQALNSADDIELKGEVEIKVEKKSNNDSNVVFIGHGRSKLWTQLKIFLQEDLNLRAITFESESHAGQSIVPILEGLLDEASFAILILTAEDDTAEGNKRARQNVIHEAGLFQGRLGFNKAILLMQKGLEAFTNVDGLQYIPFSGDEIDQTFHYLQKVLKREGMIN